VNYSGQQIQLPRIVLSGGFKLFMGARGLFGCRRDHAGQRLPRWTRTSFHVLRYRCNSARPCLNRRLAHSLSGKNQVIARLGGHQQALRTEPRLQKISSGRQDRLWIEAHHLFRIRRNSFRRFSQAIHPEEAGDRWWRV